MKKQRLIATLFKVVFILHLYIARNFSEDNYTFTMPVDGTLTTIYANFATVAAFTPTSNITLYVAIATAPSNSLDYTIMFKN